MSIKIFFINCFFVTASTLLAQQVVTGKVTSASDGTPLIAATIFVANTTIGTFSDTSGNYKLTIPGSGSYEIIISYVGFKSVFYKLDEPKSLHQLDIAMETDVKLLLEVGVKPPPSRHKQKDIDLFWIVLLGEKPSKKRIEVLNQDEIHFYLTNNNVLHVSCQQPIRIVNHDLGYNIQYILQSFQYDYQAEKFNFKGSAFYQELTPKNNSQKKSWEKKRQNAYNVSITRFIRALYRDRIHEEGFLLVRTDALAGRNEIIPLTTILSKEQDQIEIQVKIKAPSYLACYSQPVTSEMISFSYYDMFGRNRTFPVVLFFPQQFAIYPDGTYSGTMDIQEIRNRVFGLLVELPLEYGKE